MAFAVTAAALAGAGASLVGSGLDYNARKKQAKLQEENRQDTLGIVDSAYNRGIEALTPAYNNAQGARQEGMNRNLLLAGQTFLPSMETMREGSYMARQALLAGRENSRNAILGNDVDFGALQNQQLTDRFSGLTGLTNPEPMNFSSMAVPTYADSGVSEWTSFDAQSYLAQNPDIAQDYEMNKQALIEGGDPQFNTLEGFAKSHYDNFGRQEIDAGLRPALGGPARSLPQSNGVQNQPFTAQQVQNIFTESQRSPLGGRNVPG